MRANYPHNGQISSRTGLLGTGSLVSAVNVHGAHSEKQLLDLRLGSIPRSWTVVSSSERNWYTAAGPGRTARAQACTCRPRSLSWRQQLWSTQRTVVCRPLPEGYSEVTVRRVHARWLRSCCCGVTCAERVSDSSRNEPPQRKQPKVHGLSPATSRRSLSLAFSRRSSASQRLGGQRSTKVPGPGRHLPEEL